MSGLTPKVTSTRVENNPLSRAAEWLGRISLYPRLVSCNTGAERVEIAWRWCGDSPPLDPGCTIALARTVGSPGTTEITSVKVLTDPLQ